MPTTTIDLDRPLYTPITADILAERFKEASDTLKRLPKGFLKPKMTAWPDVVIDSFSLRGFGTESNRKGPPSPKAIDRMDECLQWMLAMPKENRRLVWARACGIPWRRLEDMDGRSHVTLRKHHDYALEALARNLNEAGQS